MRIKYLLFCKAYLAVYLVFTFNFFQLNKSSLLQNPFLEFPLSICPKKNCSLETLIIIAYVFAI